MQLRETKDLNEIIGLMGHVLKRESCFQIWQNTDKGRIVFEGVLKELNADDQVMMVRPNDDSFFSFLKAGTLYFKTEEKDIVFKTEPIFTSKTSLSVRVPKELRVVEQRENPRIHLDQNNPSNISLSKDLLYGKKQKSFQFRMLDVSKTGLAFMVTPHDLSHVSQGDEVSIQGLGVQTDLNLKAVIMYVKGLVPEEDVLLTQRQFRVGVQFQQELSADSLQQFSF